MKPILPALLMIAMCGCVSHRLQVADGAYDSKASILDAVQNVHEGMSAKTMLSQLVPVANTSPCFKRMPHRITRYYFGLGYNSQIWVEIENPDNLLPIGPRLPNGIVTVVGRIEPREKWAFRWEDSNELK